MFLDILFTVLGDWRWQLLILLVAAISAAYSLAAIWAVQSRDHWIIRGLVVSGLLALLLPPRAYEPLLFFLMMLPSLAALTAWQTWRRKSREHTDEPFQFSLRVLFLGMGLVASLLGLTLAALRERHRLELVMLARSPAEGVETTYANFQRRSVTYSRLMIADLAVREFAAEAGRCPKSLEELVPTYLTGVPQDPFSDQPLRYRPEPPTFVLYSVGQDRQDDGGKFGNHVQSMLEAGYDLDIDTMLSPQP